MTLRPCPTCARHVLAEASSCVFCGASLEVSSALPRTGARVARLSRALIFAGAIGAAGCGPSITYEPIHSTTTTGSMVRGHVRHHDGRPAAGVMVSIYGAQLAIGGRDSRSVQVEQDGSFRFPELPPGHYRIAVSGLADSPSFDVKAGQAAVVELELEKPKPVDTRHMAKPYGAPPARRRLV